MLMSEPEARGPQDMTGALAALGQGEAAVAALNGQQVAGRALTVNEARPREERGGGAKPCSQAAGRVECGGAIACFQGHPDVGRSRLEIVGLLALEAIRTAPGGADRGLDRPERPAVG